LSDRLALTKKAPAGATDAGAARSEGAKFGEHSFWGWALAAQDRYIATSKPFIKQPVRQKRRTFFAELNQPQVHGRGLSIEVG
jgi:hypothetical protein